MSKIDVVEELLRPDQRQRKVITKGTDVLWQADLVEMPTNSTYNEGYRYLVTTIDTFSKFAWIAPLKTKSATDTTIAMKSVFNLGRIPKNLQTDDGKEFLNKEFHNLMKYYNINHYSSYSVLKASIVERFNRALKGMMWKEFSYNNINNIQQLINEYNNKVSTNMSPSKVTPSLEESLKTSYNNLNIYNKLTFNVGDMVRISKHKHILEKGYRPNWTTEIFKIHEIQNTSPPTYILHDYESNLIDGFYEHELLKSRYHNPYLVEKILKTDGDKALVKWLGFRNQHNSWINKNEIL